MQKLIRESGAGAMDPDQFKKFNGLHERGELLAPER
jgi:hypothetical protein